MSIRKNFNETQFWLKKKKIQNTIKYKIRYKISSRIHMFEHVDRSHSIKEIAFQQNSQIIQKFWEVCICEW